MLQHPTPQPGAQPVVGGLLPEPFPTAGLPVVTPLLSSSAAVVATPALPRLPLPGSGSIEVDAATQHLQRFFADDNDLPILPDTLSFSPAVVSASARPQDHGINVLPDLTPMPVASQQQQQHFARITPVSGTLSSAATIAALCDLSGFVAMDTIATPDIDLSMLRQPSHQHQSCGTGIGGGDDDDLFDQSIMDVDCNDLPVLQHDDDGSLSQQCLVLPSLDTQVLPFGSSGDDLAVSPLVSVQPVAVSSSAKLGGGIGVGGAQEQEPEPVCVVSKRPRKQQLKTTKTTKKTSATTTKKTEPKVAKTAAGTERKRRPKVFVQEHEKTAEYLAFRKLNTERARRSREKAKQRKLEISRLCADEDERKGRLLDQVVELRRDLKALREAVRQRLARLAR